MKQHLRTLNVFFVVLDFALTWKFNNIRTFFDEFKSAISIFDFGLEDTKAFRLLMC